VVVAEGAHLAVVVALEEHMDLEQGEAVLDTT
jgi:hypothetical protein